MQNIHQPSAMVSRVHFVKSAVDDAVYSTTAPAKQSLFLVTGCSDGSVALWALLDPSVMTMRKVSDLSEQDLMPVTCIASTPHASSIPSALQQDRKANWSNIKSW